MTDTQTNDTTTNGNVKPRDFLRGIPSAIVYGLLGMTSSGLAVAAGFLPPVVTTTGTAVLFGGLLFVAELVAVTVQ